MIKSKNKQHYCRGGIANDKESYELSPFLTTDPTHAYKRLKTKLYKRYIDGTLPAWVYTGGDIKIKLIYEKSITFEYKR